MTAAHMGSPMIAQLGRGRRRAARAPLLPFLALLLAGLAGAAAVALPSPLALRGAVAASPAAAEQGLGRGSEDFGRAEWLGQCQKVSQTRHEESYGRIKRERRFRDRMRLSSMSDVCVVWCVCAWCCSDCYPWASAGVLVVCWRPTRCCMRRTVREARGRPWLPGRARRCWPHCHQRPPARTPTKRTRAAAEAAGEASL